MQNVPRSLMSKASGLAVFILSIISFTGLSRVQGILCAVHHSNIDVTHK